MQLSRTQSHQRHHLEDKGNTASQNMDFHWILSNSTTINQKKPHHTPTKTNSHVPYQKSKLRFGCLRRQQRRHHSLLLKGDSRRASLPSQDSKVGCNVSKDCYAFSRRGNTIMNNTLGLPVIPADVPGHFRERGPEGCTHLTSSCSSHSYLEAQSSHTLFVSFN